MATKDWEKIVEQEDMIVYKNTKKETTTSLGERYHYHLQIYLQDYADGSAPEWFVDLDSPSVGKTLKRTKTRNEAIKFAERYMRTH